MVVYLIVGAATYSHSNIVDTGVSKAFTTREYAVNYMLDKYREREWYRYKSDEYLEDLADGHIQEIKVEEY